MKDMRLMFDETEVGTSFDPSFGLMTDTEESAGVYVRTYRREGNPDFGIQWLEAVEKSRRIVDCVNSCAGIQNPAAIPDVVEALREIAEECAQGVDPATVPQAGIEAAPQQVVINMSVGLLRLRKARLALAKLEGKGE